jgi:hypothetical protein
LFLLLVASDLTSFAIDQTLTQWVGDVGAFISFTIPLGITSFYLGNNQLSGIFSPGWLAAPWPNLVTFSIPNNQISGPLPADLWGLPSTSLQTFDFSGNQWSGDFPPGSPQRSLTTLSFQRNPLLLSTTITGLPAFAKASSSFIKDSSG